MSLQVEVPAGGDSGGGSAETPASTRLARELSAQLGGVLAQPPRSLGAASGAFSQGAAAAASANLQAIKFAQVSGYDTGLEGLSKCANELCFRTRNILTC